MIPVTTANKQKEKSPAGHSKKSQNSLSLHKQKIKQPNYLEIIQRLRKQPNSLTQEDIYVLQKSIGNQAVIKLLSDIKRMPPQYIRPDKDKENTSNHKDNQQDKQQPDSDNKLAVSENNKQGEASKEENLIKNLQQKNQNKPDNKEASDLHKDTVAKPAANKKDKDIASENKKAAESASEKISQVKLEKEAHSEAVSKKTSQVSKDSVVHSEPAPKKTSQDSKDNAAYEEPAQTTAAAGSKTASAVPEQQNAAANKKSAKQAAKAASSVKITGDDPAKILNQMGNVPPTEIYNAFSQASSVSDGAFEKQREKAQATIPEIPAPTGLPPKKGGIAAKIAQKVKEMKHKEPSNFKSAKTGGKAAEGIPTDINLSTDPEADADDVMAEAREYSKNTPTIGMEGEADPGQMEGFEAEAAQNVSAAQQAELEQTNQDFGENSIAPQEDSTILKAKKTIAKVSPLGMDINRVAPIAPDVAAIANPQLNSELRTFMTGKEGQFAQGKGQFDSGLVNAKKDANEKIENEKTQARETQLQEQANAKAEVEGYRNQWKTEINAATADYDKEAGAEAEKKKKEVGDIKREKEGEVKKTMSEAEKDADKECKTAKKEAEDKKQEGEKERKKNIFEKAWDWTKDKIEKAVDFVKNAVSFIFDKLRQAVKTIFEKAKQAALGLIEQGRKLIVGAIKGLGNVLKGLVKKVFAKFPGISKKLCGLIDRAVDKSTKAVNAAAGKLKKGVTAVLDFMAKSVDGLLAGMQNLYKSVMSGIKKFLNMDFKKIFNYVIEGATIAAELAAAVLTGGGSVIVQIVTWLATTLPQLLKQAGAVMDFVNTIRSVKLADIKQFLSPAGIGDFLVKGLFGKLKNLPQEPKDKEEKEPASGKESKGLIKVLHALTKVLNVLKNVYDKVAGGVNKVLGIINITKKGWFEPFSAIYAGIVTVIEKVGNPAQALSEGAEKLKEAVGGFFDSVKTKVKDISGSIKEKVTILGKPAQLMKMLANKAVDMVLNFIITHPPSALIKALFKGIEAIAGKSIVELIRQYIPYADKIFDKIAGSGPVQGIMKPLEGPVNKVGGMIDQVTDEVTNMVDSAEKTTLSSIGSGAKLMSAMGLGGAGGPGGSSKGGNTAAGGKDPGKAQGGGKGDSKGGSKNGGGDFFGTIKSGIHDNLMSLGLVNLKKLGTQILAAGASKVASAIRKALTPKVKFKLGTEEHQLWVEKGQNRNVVMMASDEKTLDAQIQAGKIPNNGEVLSDKKKAEDPKNETKAEPNVRELAGTIETITGSKGESEGPVVKAFLTLNGKKYYDVNPTARNPRPNPGDSISGLSGINNSTRKAHAEIGALYQALKDGNSGGKCVLRVEGQRVCDYCHSDVKKMAQKLSLDELIVIDESGTYKFIGLSEFKNVSDGGKRWEDAKV